MRPGPQWISGTVIERLGPLSFLVQVSGDRVWKRHIDHLREMRDSPIVPEVIPPPPPLSDPVPNTPELTIDPPMSTTLESDPVETPNKASSESMSEELSLQSPTQAVQSSPEIPPPSTPVRRYPTRNRRPPDRYRDMYT